MAFFFKANAEVLEGLGLANWVNVPFLLSVDLDYLDEVNRFLRELATGVWNPKERTRTEFATRIMPCDNTLEAFGRDLENWLSYMECSQKCWRTCSASELCEYEHAMLRGEWSADHSPLSKNTVKRRVAKAEHFLSWSVERGLRSPANNTRLIRC